MISLNEQFEFIRQSPTVSMADRVNQMKARGQRVIGLQTGDPDLATPPAVLDIALNAMKAGLTHYGPSRGFPEFRQAAAIKLERDNGVSYDPEREILATHGGIHAFYLAMQSIINPGDDVLIPDPTWATHANMAIMLRGRAIRVPATHQNGFLPPIEDWEKALTDRTKAIVINYPSNPTGVYPSREYLSVLQEFASVHNLWVISDEVYENLYYGIHPTCAAAVSEAKERTILVHSLSKTYSMTGWRIGYLAAPPVIIENALKASQNSITCVAPFIQKAATFALSDPDIQVTAGSMRAKYEQRRALVMRVAAEVESEKVMATAPMGAFYYFLDFRKLGVSSQEICERLLSEEGIGLVPGAAFGKNGEGFVRMTIAASDEDIENGFRTILNWAERQ